MPFRQFRCRSRAACEVAGREDEHGAVIRVPRRVRVAVPAARQRYAKVVVVVHAERAREDQAPLPTYVASLAVLVALPSMKIEPLIVSFLVVALYESSPFPSCRCTSLP